MTPDEARDAKLLDGLLASYGKLEGTTGRHHERLRGLEADVSAIRTENREAIREVAVAVREVGQACEKKIGDLDAKFDKRRERNEWTLGMKVALASATFSPAVAAVALVLK